MAKFNLTYSRGSISPLKCDGFLYTIRPGDTLYDISKREQISLDRLLAANPQIRNPDELKPGDRICIPRGEHDPNTNPNTNPLKRLLGWRFALLLGTSESPDTLGLALVRPHDPAWVAVIGFNLREPSSFGEDFDTYKAWVIDTPSYSRFRLDMRNVADGIWLAEGKDGDLSGFDQVIVTPEPSPGITTPTGPAVLEGTLSGG
ncbi:MAG: LysM peptidoglycan-binding domain-containing protein [Syntrophomonadales bacterium]